MQLTKVKIFKRKNTKAENKSDNLEMNNRTFTKYCSKEVSSRYSLFLFCFNIEKSKQSKLNSSSDFYKNHNKMLREVPKSETNGAPPKPVHHKMISGVTQLDPKITKYLKAIQKSSRRPSIPEYKLSIDKNRQTSTENMNSEVNFVSNIGLS